MPHIKTKFDLQPFKDWVNSQLKRRDPEATDEYKKALCHALEHVLKSCNQDVEFDYTYWKESGYLKWMKAGQPAGDQKKTYILGPSGQEYNRTYD